MSPSLSFAERLRQAWADGLSAYVVALVATGLAWLLTVAVEGFVGGTNIFFFLIAIALSGWRGGLGPGLLAALSSLLVLLVWLPAPSFPLADRTGETGRLLLATATALFLTALVAGRYRAQRARRGIEL